MQNKSACKKAHSFVHYCTSVVGIGGRELSHEMSCLVRKTVSHNGGSLSGCTFNGMVVLLSSQRLHSPEVVS